MYEQAVIKKFETSQIEVSPRNIYKVTVVTCILYAMSYILSFVVMYGVTQAFPPSLDITGLNYLTLILIFSGLMGSLLTIFFHLSDTCKGVIPAYTVSITGTTDTDYDRTFYGVPNIYIPKTTPEQDQIKICKAAQSLEQYAIESDKEQAMIRGLAEKCK